MRTKHLGRKKPCPHCKGKGYIYINSNIGFIPPTVEEIQEYADGIGYPELDSEMFHLFYANRGWKRANGKPMESAKNWKLSVHTWKNNDRKQTKKFKKAKAKNVPRAKGASDEAKKAAGVLAKAYNHVAKDDSPDSPFFEAAEDILSYFAGLPVNVKRSFSGGKREFFNDYRQFIQDKYAGWEDFRPGMLAKGSAAWGRFVRHEEQSIGLNFKTGKGKW